MQQILQISSKVYAFSFDLISKKAMWYLVCGLCYTLVQSLGMWFSTVCMPNETAWMALEAIAVTTTPSILCFLFFSNKIQESFIELEDVASSIIFILILTMLYPIVSFILYSQFCVELDLSKYLFFIGTLNILLTARCLYVTY